MTKMQELLNILRDELHNTALTKGFWEIGELEKLSKSELIELVRKYEFPARLMLIVTELGECCEGHRKGDWKNVTEELSDSLIRILDVCGGYGIDIGKGVHTKMNFNKTRPHRHGKKY